MRYNGKTETLFDRNDDFKIMVGAFRKPEFEFVNKWYVTQKLDGTSGILYFLLANDGYTHASIHGRTAKAQYNPDVYAQLESLVKRIYPQVLDSMRKHDLNEMAFYGEVYGPKVQGGGRYRNDIGFAVFDIIVNDKVYLNPESVTQACKDVGLDEVPFLGLMTTDEIVKLVRNGQQSVVTNGHDFVAEGVVAKSPFFDNVGRQVKFKLKATDF
jgi:hypothetical protein